MLIWTITTAFSGVFQPLLWLDHASDSDTEKRLVWTLLALSIGGMAGNVRDGLILAGDLTLTSDPSILGIVCFFVRRMCHDETSFA